MAKKAAAKAKETPEVKVAPARPERHPLICPFSGMPMEIRCVGADAHFMVISPHGFTSKLMKSRDECMEWASCILGVQTFDAPRISVRTLDEPDRSAEDGLAEIMPEIGDVGERDLPPSLR